MSVVLPEFPAAKLLLPADASREEWLNVRRGGLGASDISTIVGINPYSSPYEVWLEKTGRSKGKATTRRMKMGNILEPVVREVFEDETGLTVRPVGLLQSIEHPFARCTPDGYASDGAGFEAKTTNWRNRDDWEGDQVSDHAEIQAQFSMGVSGLEAWHVAGMIDADPDDFHRKLVERDQHLIDMLFEEAEHFHVDYVLADVAPPMTGNALAAVKALHPSVERPHVELDPAEVQAALAAYHAALALEKAAKDQKNAASARLIELIGDAEEARVNGTKAFTYKQQNREAYTVKASSFRSLYVPKPKKIKESVNG